jgi:hypothetical protein
MGIAISFGAHRPVGSSSFAGSECTPQPTPDSLAKLRDRPSGCFSNQHRQEPLRIEILNSERRVHKAFAWSAARRRDRREMRRRPAEIDLSRGRSAKRLMRAEVRVVDEAHLDLRREIFRHERPQQAQAERVLQRPLQAFDQRDGALPSDRPSLENTLAESGIRENAALRIPEPTAGSRGDGQRPLRIRPIVRAESFQPARASVRAIRSFPPKPASSIVLTTALTTSAKRRTGGFVAIKGRATSRSAPASTFHRAIVSVDTRNISAVSRCDMPRKLLIRRIRKRCSGA